MANLRGMEFCNLKMAAFIKVNSLMERKMDLACLLSRKTEIL